MRKFLILKLASLMLIGTAWAQSPKVVTLARAIARTEGYFIKGTIPNRLHNPGDIRTRLPHAYPGQAGTYHGYAVFRGDAGWTALEALIQRVIDGTSTRYDQSMTFGHIARIYAESPNWRKTLCSILKITPSVTFEEYFGLPPRVRIEWDGSLDALRTL